MKSGLDILRERGFIAQVTFEDELEKLFQSGEMVTFYTGFDPTADSLHIGHYIPIMAMSHLQRAGHRPIALMGGGTAMVGDPSGKTDMRKMLSVDDIDNNVQAVKKQMARFLDFDPAKPNCAILTNNADWLRELKYVEFLRDVGALFSVNRMLTAECYKQRLEKGLTFLEFNYMLMQAYDFLVLFQKYGCCLQLGGDDQWANILAGADLIRKKEGKPSYAMTFALLTTSEGKKMGKTAKGALWLDKDKTSPYEFYQYFRNVQDADVKNCLCLLTMLPLEEIEELTRHKDERINAAKERLAYEVTKLVHGEKEAEAAQNMARAAFSGDADNMPAVKVSAGVGRKLVDIMVAAKLAPSKSEARRLIEGGGVLVEDEQVKDINFEISEELYSRGQFTLHKGKKVHVRAVIADE